LLVAIYKSLRYSNHPFEATATEAFMSDGITGGCLCGSAVFSRNSGNPGMIFPRVSSLDDPNIISPQMIVYASRAASWDHMDPSLPAFAEMPDDNPLASEHG
jgi:hypothetical protein